MRRNLDSSAGVTFITTRATTEGPPATEVADTLAGRAPVAAVLGDPPAGSRAARSGLGTSSTRLSRRA